jgi:hypothetical protein
MPQWHSSLLLGFDEHNSNQPLLYVIDRNGVTEGIALDIPGSSSITMLSWGAGSDRSIVAAGIARTVDSRGTGFISWVSPDRNHRVFIRTDRFFAKAVAVAADGTIWAAGQEAQDENFNTWKNNLIRRYDSSGKTLQSFVVAKAKARAGYNDPSESSWLLPSGDRVGWFTGGYEYIEFSLDGQEVDRFDGPPGMNSYRDFAGVALSVSNELVVGIRANDTRILALDRPTRTWVPVSLPTSVSRGWNEVMGFDGSTLITMPRADTLRRFTPAASSQ